MKVVSPAFSRNFWDKKYHKFFVLAKHARRHLLYLHNGVASSFHKGGKIKELINAAGYELQDLPAYSPDLNPIELKQSDIMQL